ncbi:MAG: hypothetical protein U0Z26_07055 [Anaerolineales bacterium]
MGCVVLWANRKWRKDRDGRSQSAKYVGWFIVIVFFISVIGSIIITFLNKEKLNSSQGLLVVFMTYNIVFVTLAGTLMEIGENNRFRFAIDPFLLLLFVFVLKEFASLFHARKMINAKSNFKS